MTVWKTSNDGYCVRCRVNTRLHQPTDFRIAGRGSKSERWYCKRCLLTKFGIDIEHDKTTWGDLLYPYED